jgi:hypothetical protein
VIVLGALGSDSATAAGFCNDMKFSLPIAPSASNTLLLTVSGGRGLFVRMRRAGWAHLLGRPLAFAPASTCSLRLSRPSLRH